MTFRTKDHVCKTLEDAHEQCSHLSAILADAGNTTQSLELQRLMGPVKTVAHRIGADGCALGEGAVWYYGDALRDAVWAVRDWAITNEPKETQQPVWEAYVEFHNALEHAVLIADICELRDCWPHTS